MFDRAANDWRETFLRQALVVGLLLTLGTEFLSVFDLLTRGGVVLFWSMAGVVAVLFRRRGSASWGGLAGQGRFELGVAIYLGILVVALFVQGLFSAPNTFDSMTYHLSRVMHWAQHKNIEFFPTAMEEQLWMPPLAEYAILHLYLLADNDRLAFLVQWVAYIGCVLTASLIAGILGGDRRVQVAGAALCAAIPMAVLQAVSTQTDLIASFWGASAVAWFLLWLKRGYLWSDAVCGSLALALGVLTKTSVLLVLPVLMMVLVLAKRRFSVRRLLLGVGFVLVTVVLINGPHLARIYRCFHSLNPLVTQGRLMTQGGVWETFVSGSVRNVALHLLTPSDRVNAFVRQGVERLLQGLGVNGDDPAISLSPTEAYLKKQHLFYESRAPNGLHFLLGLIVSGFVLRYRRMFSPLVIGYTMAVIAGFLVLSSCMKWQPWGTRFQLPLFICAAPLLAFVMACIDHHGRFFKAIVIFALVAVVPWVVLNTSHPWVGENAFYRTSREDQYFLGGMEKKPFFTAMVQQAVEAKCALIGVELSSQENWEYPAWVMLRARGMRPDIQYLHVKGMSAGCGPDHRKPCLVVGGAGVVP